MTPPSLCHSCTFVREVSGRRDQTYLLCQNETIEAKYPRQPILRCPGYHAVSGGPGSMARR
jgi:hypothetical protein